MNISQMQNTFYPFQAHWILLAYFGSMEHSTVFAGLIHFQNNDHHPVSNYLVFMKLGQIHVIRYLLVQQGPILTKLISI